MSFFEKKKKEPFAVFQNDNFITKVLNQLSMENERKEKKIVQIMKKEKKKQPRIQSKNYRLGWQLHLQFLPTQRFRVGQ